MGVCECVSNNMKYIRYAGGVLSSCYLQMSLRVHENICFECNTSLTKPLNSVGCFFLPLFPSFFLFFLYIFF